MLRPRDSDEWEKTMFLLARYTVAAAVFLSASAASAAEDATLSADQVLPACAAFIAERAPREIDEVFQAGRCIGLMQGLGYASQLLGVCPPDDVTEALRARVAVTYVEAHPERMDAAGEIQEHLAGVEDYLLAEAVWREAMARWPKATIILRQGARVVHDSRRPRVVK
jgi:hypothetical protein